MIVILNGLKEFISVLNKIFFPCIQLMGRKRLVYILIYLFNDCTTVTMLVVNHIRRKWFTFN